MRKTVRRNNKKGLYIGLGVAAVVLLVAGFFGYNYWSKQQRNERAEETAQSFLEALEKQEFSQLSEIISPSSLEEIDYSTEEVQERYETIFQGIGASEIAASDVALTEDEESGVYTLNYKLAMQTSLGELAPQSYTTTLQETEGEFTVDWDPSLIFPEMEPGDTVRIQFNSGKRGNIFDRNGELLAGEGTVWQAGLYPARLGEGEERENNLQVIAEVFNTSVEHLESLLSASWVTAESFVPFSMRAEGETPEVTGVVYQQTTARSYPLGEAAAHLIGYIGEVSAEDIEKNPTRQPGDVIGKAGLEAAFDERLQGNRGGQILIMTSENDVKHVLQEATVQDGEDIYLTIDASLQRAYYEQFEGKSGTAVVTEPTSGELLVLTSSPSYNPTLMARGISAEDYQEYVDNPKTPFLARYASRYAPGSTFKAITAGIGLEAGTTTLEKTRNITGLEWQKDDSWGGFVITRVSDYPTEVNLEDALVYSDNIYFAQEALDMGAEVFLDGLSKFPFGEEFELPISMQPAQISNSGSLESESLLADTAFGQGQLLMSPIQQAVFYGAFANQGEIVYPTLELNNESGKSVQAISPETADIVKELLVQVVENPAGTANVLNNSGSKLAAKTGTAEYQSPDTADKLDINGFLVAFDAEEDSFLSLILVEDISGSDVAVQFSPLF